MSKSVYLAVGHGLKPDGTYDPGAISKNGRRTEQSDGDVVVQAVADALDTAGVSVTHEAFRDDYAFEGSVRAVNRSNYDLAVSVHHDWNGAPSGGFGFWYPGSAAGKAAADAILRNYKRRQLPVRQAWHKARSLAFTRRTNAPAVLWECGRIGEFSSVQLDEVAEAIAYGIAEHLGVDLDATPPPEKSTATTATEALTEIKDHLGIRVGGTWNVEDFRVVSNRVRGA